MSDTPLVSIIVPVWRDAEALRVLLSTVGNGASADVIVSVALDEVARYAGIAAAFPHVRWTQSPRGRGAQMNAGAALAAGRWLLFVHADSRLPPRWLEVIRSADQRVGVVGGAYRLTLDSADRRARIVEAGVRARVALLNLPYGDQGLFVRKEVFAALGGYRDLPLMEDVDFVRRLRGQGALHHSPEAVVTSARRWERDGWFRRSAGNAVLATSFLLGIPPRRLARRYTRRRPHAVVVMARAPWMPGKTRLRHGMEEDAHRELRQALFLDTLDVVRSVGAADRVIACEPAEACAQLRDALTAEFDVIAQRGGADLGARLACVFEDVFRLGAETVTVIGSDLPDLPPHLLETSIEALRRSPRRVVLGPATDGGYYLVGLGRNLPELFQGIDWGSHQVLAQTIDAARRAGAEIVLLDSWSDVDDPDDLQDLATRSQEGRGVRCRRWLGEHGAATLRDRGRSAV